MRKMFNGLCSLCEKLKPRCALVHMRADGKATAYLAETRTLCEECRKKKHGGYRLADLHK